jgi:hypothetical protein
LKTLGRYLTRYRKGSAQGSGADQPHRFIPVEIAGFRCGGGELTVVLPGGVRIEVKCGFDSATLRQLVSALEA